jgi:multisubunit Na+/H+ antiporter MnhB subunit
MVAIVFGLALIVLGVLALVKEVLDLYVIVGLALILTGAWILFGARDLVRARA